MLTTPQMVIDRARSLWYVSSSQYSDTNALEDYNIVRSQLSNQIMQNVNENYFSEILKTTWVVGQNEYALTDDVNSVNINKVEDVFIKYTATGDYVKCTKTDKDSLQYDLDEYNTRQANTSPFYYVFADSVFIYPAITDLAVTEWVKVEVAITPSDLAISDTDTLFPREYRSVLALWMLPLIYQRRWLINEAANANRVFTEAADNMVFNLSDRVSVPQNLIMPDLSRLG